tara:strand:+ start:114 stop:506 length:393 start_codon:yes stop_codon:yes gene_type:complete
MIRSSILDPDFNIMFPYETFPWRLEVNKDCHNVKGIALTVCHFECEEHLQKYLDRYKLKPKDYQVSNRDGKSLKSSKKHKTNVSKGSRKSNNGGTSSVRKRKSSMDSTRDTVSDTKCLENSRKKKNSSLP